MTVYDVRPRLPEYQLDFGAVVLSSVETRSVKARNAGSCPVSFAIDRLQAESVGFSVQLDSVSKLPPNDSVDIPVTFDPRLVNLDLSKIEETIVINVRLYSVTVVLLVRFISQPTVSAWVERSRRLSVCLFVCPQHNSKMNDPKVFKLGIGNDFGLS